MISGVGEGGRGDGGAEGDAEGIAEGDAEGVAVDDAEGDAVGCAVGVAICRLAAAGGEAAPRSAWGMTAAGTQAARHSSKSKGNKARALIFHLLKSADSSRRLSRTE